MPPRSPPLPEPTLVTKKVITDFAPPMASDCGTCGCETDAGGSVAGDCGLCSPRHADMRLTATSAAHHLPGVRLVMADIVAEVSAALWIRQRSARRPLARRDRSADDRSGTHRGSLRLRGRAD